MAAVTGALLIRKLGRRTLFIVSSAGMLTCQQFPSFIMVACTKDIVYSIFGVVSYHVPLSYEFCDNGCLRLVGITSGCTLLTIFLLQLPFHSFSCSISPMIWLIRQCLSHTLWRFSPSPYERRGLHSWSVIL